ncbi:MAG: exonuclease SbcCD subunit D [Armatimonadetes bacterium]|nr:exonuclease SbcCD subunit D [Armatimonadota bacterium]MDW8028039.1 exonuclease SbcCD subunit D [Armatimonadota bacterium]
MRVLHFSDAHLGAEIHGKKDPQTGMHSQLKDFLRCMDFVVETAIEKQVDAVLFTGDAYHNRRPDPLSQREFIKRIIALSDKGISVLLLAGNHDLPPVFGEASALDIFEIVRIPGVIFVRKPNVVNLMTRKGELQVVCIPYLPRRALVTFEEERGLDEDGIQKLMARRFDDLVEKLVKNSQFSDAPTILAGHIWVQGAEFAGSEKIMSAYLEPVVPPSTLRNPKFAYVALGHIHRHQAFDDFSPPIVYAGSLGRLDFGEEKQPKGFVMVELEQTQRGQWIANWEFIQTPTRPFVTIKVDVRNSNNPFQSVAEAIGKSQIDGAVVKVQIFAKESQRELINLAKVRELMEKRADHIVSVEFLADERYDVDFAVERNHQEFEELLRRDLISLLEDWLDELAKKDKEIGERKKRIVELAQKLREALSEKE